MIDLNKTANIITWSQKMTSSFCRPECETTPQGSLSHQLPSQCHLVVAKGSVWRWKKWHILRLVWKVHILFFSNHIEIIKESKKGNETLQPAPQYWLIRRYCCPVQHVKTRSCVWVARISVIVTSTTWLNVVSLQVLFVSQQLLLGLMHVMGWPAY